MRAAAHRARALVHAASSTLVVGSLVVSVLVPGRAFAAPPLHGTALGSSPSAGNGFEERSFGTLGMRHDVVPTAHPSTLSSFVDAGGTGGGAGGGAWLGALDAPASDQGSPSGETSAEAAPGDLRGALESARARREAAPGIESALAEADACEALGDYACAKAALRDVIEDSTATQAQRDEATARLDELEEQSRGRNVDPVAPEPESTHRERIDGEREARLAALNPPPPPPPEPVKDKPERIVRKWYFWVTVAAIGAAAGAITGIAVKAAADERRDSLDASSGSGPANSMGPALLRF